MDIKKEDLLKILKKNKFVKQYTAQELGVGEASIRRACIKYDIDTDYEKNKMFADAEVKSFDVAKSSSKKKVGVGKFVVISDLHSTHVARRSFNAVLKFIEDFAPEVIIQIGDLLDLYVLMEKVKQKNPAFSEQDFKDIDRDFEVGAELLSDIGAVAPKDCKKVWTLGNHEYRIDVLLEKFPHFASYLAIKNRMNIADWEVLPYLTPYKLGKLNVFHGEFWNISHMRKHLQVYQKNMLYGHTHSISQETLQSPLRELPTWAGNIGCLCDLSPDYQRNKSNKWEHGFCYGYFDKKTGDFFPCIQRILRHRFIAEGRWYSG